MTLFNPTDIEAVAKLIEKFYTTKNVLKMYAEVEEDFLDLISQTSLGEEVILILVHKKNNDELINKALEDLEFQEKLIKAMDSVMVFDKKYEGVLHRLRYCVDNYKTAGEASILNNLGKAAVLLKMETPFSF